ncbi:MAG: Asp-tRNA(Asn)/Glu-tRNA(Gln) amidotransferase GatCAB subunit C [Bacilli bacterium]|nr:Asp-tRNA(Asn)/Glu-tRNA(Gln) amidotransferase GatCAB subunit C [Bacilli bacterium]
MKTANEKTLLEAAHNLMFDINDVELEVLKEEYADILDAIEEMKSIPNIDQLRPMIFPYEIVTDYLREDVTDNVLDKKEALKNASKVEDGQIVIPKVVK